ncbi:MAG: DUF1499 domain-containing protein [Rhodospirillales bacterium]|nr:DUF1499 domain-containing protein [Rhodospirillales bacterium]
MAADGEGSGVSAGKGVFMDFATLIRASSPNSWLVAPKGLEIPPPPPDGESPVFNVPPTDLAQAWIAIIKRQPRVTVVAVSPDGRHIEARQVSKVFGFIDDISAAIVPLGATGSTIAVYSRSRVGYWDLGVNRARVRAWLAALSERIATTGRD